MTISMGTVTAAPSRGPVIGLAVQFLLLAALAGTVGLTVAGWLAGAAYGVVLCGLLARGLHRARMDRLGPANLVTFARALMVGGVTAMVVSGYQRPTDLVVLVTLVGVALALDGVDGQVARRTGSSSPLGARFDMEVDSILVLVLSICVAAQFGWWTIAVGGFRYAFAAAAWALPWLTAPTAPRFSRKVVAATQGVVLVVATAQILPHPVALVAMAAVVASLTWSFGLDIGWLWRAEQTRRRSVDRVVVPRRRAVAPDRPLHASPAQAG